MQIAPATFVAALFAGQSAIDAVMQQALRAVAGEAATEASTEVDWSAVSARALAILDEGDAKAAADRDAAASGEFALADLFPPATVVDRAALNADVVAGIKLIGRTLGVSLI